MTQEKSGDGGRQLDARVCYQEGEIRAGERKGVSSVYGWCLEPQD